MKTNKVISVILILVLALSTFAACGTGEKSVILDKDGNVMCHITSFDDGVSDAADPYLNAYVDIVKNEACRIIEAQNSIDTKEAQKYILKNPLTINTCFDSLAYGQLKKAAESDVMEGCNVALSATETDGGLLAVFSKNLTYDYINLATKRTAPYSAIKPLSVYAPAIDCGMINWATMKEDSPVKQITDVDGQLRDWPSNASGIYSMENTSVNTAIKHSLNTIAVKTLIEYGVSESISFMESKLSVDLTYEKDIMEAYGEDEILSALALGYLNDGISPVEMSGYYQIFANEGRYTEPFAVLSIMTAEGEELYNQNKLSSYYPKKNVQIIERSTAFIMNKLLQTVVDPDGTGSKAYISGLPIAAKTGTGTNFEGNWFVGVTPTFCISVWHDDGLMKNRAAEVFKIAAEDFPVSDRLKNKTDFPPCPEVIEGAYCKESGLFMSEGCRDAELGYFNAKHVPERCKKH